MRGIAVYECARCGYQLNPVAAAAFEQSWGATELPVCPDRRDCYRRERDRVSRVPPLVLGVRLARPCVHLRAPPPSPFGRQPVASTPLQVWPPARRLDA